MKLKGIHGVVAEALFFHSARHAERSHFPLRSLNQGTVTVTTFDCAPPGAMTLTRSVVPGGGMSRDFIFNSM
jgi:hypothetical protein